MYKEIEYKKKTFNIINEGQDHKTALLTVWTEKEDFERMAEDCKQAGRSTDYYPEENNPVWDHFLSCNPDSIGSWFTSTIFFLHYNDISEYGIIEINYCQNV